MRTETAAAKVIARGPLGHAVAIQKRDTAPMVANARRALTTAGSQSGTCKRAAAYFGTARGGSTTKVRPLRARAMPSSPFAALSASNCNDGVSARKATSDRAAMLHARRRFAGSLIQWLAGADSS